ncbi:MAG: hypothetical protein ACOY4I_13390 [Bacillota bacterium]
MGTIKWAAGGAVVGAVLPFFIHTDFVSSVIFCVVIALALKWWIF